LQSQLELLNAIVPLGLKFPDSPSNSNFYYSNNDQYGDGDAFVFSGIVQYLRPSRVIEIGSGFSTAVLMDTLLSLDLPAAITAIDPYPQRLEQLFLDKKSLLKPSVQVKIIPQRVQEVDVQIYGTLEAGDILFIDSSHVSKTGSDVNFELFEIFPLLKPGVWVHIHDMFWPFEYPVEWIEQGRSWNENYLIRAYLTGNSRLRVRFFQQYLYHEHYPSWGSVIAKGINNPGGGLWLEIM
jgi:hypothetical protein